MQCITEYITLGIVVGFVVGCTAARLARARCFARVCVCDAADAGPNPAAGWLAAEDGGDGKGSDHLDTHNAANYCGGFDYFVCVCVCREGEVGGTSSGGEFSPNYDSAGRHCYGVRGICDECVCGWCRCVRGVKRETAAAAAAAADTARSCGDDEKCGGLMNG